MRPSLFIAMAAGCDPHQDAEAQKAVEKKTPLAGIEADFTRKLSGITIHVNRKVVGWDDLF